MNPLAHDASAAETITSTGLSYEQELKKAIQERSKQESLFEGFFGAPKVSSKCMAYPNFDLCTNKVAG